MHFARCVVIAAMALIAAGCSKGGNKTVSADEMTLGNPNAKVTVIEYASVACPVCANFNNTVFPAFKTKYIDTGKVKYVSREALTGNPTLAAAGFLMARCAGKDKYFSVIDAIYHAQDEIYDPGTESVGSAGRGVLLRIAQQAGLNESQFTACVSDDAALKALNARAEKYAKLDDVDATPTFIVNGKKLVGDQSLAEFDNVIQPLLK